jgi:hypothetical protein
MLPYAILIAQQFAKPLPSRSNLSQIVSPAKRCWATRSGPSSTLAHHQGSLQQNRRIDDRLKKNLF